jgi:hypothetical protein
MSIGFIGSSTHLWFLEEQRPERSGDLPLPCIRVEKIGTAQSVRFDLRYLFF